MGKLNKDAKYFVISDTHIACHNCMDMCNYDKLIPFLQDVLNNTQATLVLNGDIFEYTKERKSKVKKKNLEIFDILEELRDQDRLIRIRGNHDEDADIKSKIIDNDVIVFHGDNFGEHSGILPFFSSILNFSVALTERLFRMNINDILRKFTGYDRKKARKEKMRQKAQNFLKENPKYRALIVGHSHTPESDGNYYNSGCFINGESDYIEITDGDIKLKKY